MNAVPERPRRRQDDLPRISGAGCNAPSESTRQHPCYGEEAAHRFARMHVPIAPACHLQCNYCNRKYDCANESRPGVTSRVLTVEEALERVALTRGRLPQLRVVGVAGPGDALANPERTFPFLEGLRRRFPDLMPCLSTNGLALPRYLPELIRLGVHHVTVTLNTLNPVVGAAIHPWLFWNTRRRTGLEAASILLENQLKGVEGLVKAGVMVKVNSVLIPGVNEAGLPELNQVVGEMGVAVHNIMPLLAAPESGTWYARCDQPVPSQDDLDRVRARCGGDAYMMRHCRQCRADAEGMLTGESPLLPLRVPSGSALPIFPKPVASRFRVAVASRTGERVDLHFGHATGFRIYHLDPSGIAGMEDCSTPAYCQGTESCGEGLSPMEAIVEALRGCRAVVCERIGPDPQDALRAAGIEPVQRFPRQPVLEALATLNREWRL